MSRRSFASIFLTILLVTLSETLAPASVAEDQPHVIDRVRLGPVAGPRGIDVNRLTHKVYTSQPAALSWSSTRPRTPSSLGSRSR